MPLALPRWSKPGLYFAVTVAEDFPESAPARAILSLYRRWTVGATAAILAVGVLALSGPDELAAWTHVLLLPQLAVFTWIYLRVRRRVLPHAASRSEPEVRISEGPGRLPGGWPGQVRRLQPASTGAGALGDGTDDRHWKAGLVYYDPDDPTIFIEKRFGIGYTMNMARPATWWLLGTVVGLPLLVALLLGLLG